MTRAIKIVATSALALLAPSVAAADVTPQLIQYAPAPLLNPATGALYAAGGTGIGVSLIAAGFASQSPGVLLLGVASAMVAPSAGHIYAGDTSHAVWSSLLRGGTLLIGMSALVSSWDLGPEADGDDTSEQGLMVASAATFLGSTVYDIYDAPRAVDRANRRSAVRIAPTAVVAQEGIAPGLALGGAF